MKKRLLIGLAVLGVGFLAGLMVIPRSGTGPLYQGKTLKSWAMRLFAPAPEVREQAAAVFRSMGTNAVPGLIQLLESKDLFWRKQLWRVGLRLPPGLRRGLLRHSPVPDEETVHQAAAKALNIIGPGANAAIPALARLLRRQERVARWDVAFAMASIGKDSVPALTDALTDSDPEVRAAAIAGLDKLGPAAEASVPALIERLQDESADIRLRAGNALFTIGPAAATVLIDVVMRGKGVARQGAAKMLISMPSSRRAAEPALIEMLLDEDPASRAQAIRTLAAIRAADAPAVTAITTALKDPAPEVRFAAAKGLGLLSLKAQSAVPALIEALNEQSEGLREAAAEALGNFGAPAKSAVPGLKRLLDDPAESVRLAAKHALAQIEAGPATGSSR